MRRSRRKEAPATRRLVLAVVSVFALATPAKAAVVSVVGDALTFTARPGEVNLVTFRYTVNDPETGVGATTIRDRGAPLRPARGCRAIDAATVTCARRGEFWRDDIALRDGADVAQVVGRPRQIEIRLGVSALAGAQRISLEAFTPARPPRLINVAAGAGDDTISGSRNDESLRGGAGDDNIRGRAGRDGIDGGSGEDTVAGGAGPDVVDGGPGNDALVGGPSGDLLSGGDGADLVVGGAGGDLVQGEAGRDRLVGGAGDDRLVGDVSGSPAGANQFFDQFFGGFGDDTFFARDGVRDYLDGGIGSDRACIDRRLDRNLRVETIACRAAGARLTGRA